MALMFLKGVGGCFMLNVLILTSIQALAMRKQINNIRNRITLPQGCRERFLPLEHPSASSLAEIGVCLAGLSRLSSGYEIGYAQPPSHMIIGTVSGAGWFHSGSASWQLKPDTLLLAPPGQPLAFGVSQGHWEIVWLYLRDLPRWAPLKRRGPLRFHSSLATRLHSALAGLLHETGWATAPAATRDAIGNMNRPGRRSTRGSSAAGLASLRAGRLWSQLVQHYLEEAFASRTTPEDESRRRLDALWQNVHEHPANPWRIEEMCAHLHVAPATLQRLVTRSEGFSPRQMIIRIRIETAERLLVQTRYPIQIIAQQVGYADQFSFSTAFRQKTGLSPREFRTRSQPAPP
jgi:AraC family transcriptional regulator, activator of mtrCDE